MTVFGEQQISEVIIGICLSKMSKSTIKLAKCVLRIMSSGSIFNDYNPRCFFRPLFHKLLYYGKRYVNAGGIR